MELHPRAYVDKTYAFHCLFVSIQYEYECAMKRRMAKNESAGNMSRIGCVIEPLH